jgi:hypothetical protein
MPPIIGVVNINTSEVTTCSAGHAPEGSTGTTSRNLRNKPVSRHTVEYQRRLIHGASFQNYSQHLCGFHSESKNPMQRILEKIEPTRPMGSGTWSQSWPPAVVLGHGFRIVISAKVATRVSQKTQNHDRCLSKRHSCNNNLQTTQIPSDLRLRSSSTTLTNAGPSCGESPPDASGACVRSGGVLCARTMEGLLRPLRQMARLHRRHRPLRG